MTTVRGDPAGPAVDSGGRARVACLTAGDGEAIHLRNHVLGRLDAAASASSPEGRRTALTFVFVGDAWPGWESGKGPDHGAGPPLSTAAA